MATFNDPASPGVIERASLLTHNARHDDLGSAIHITGTSSTLSPLGQAQALAGNIAQGTATVRGALAGTLQVRATSTASATVSQVNVLVFRRLTATPLGKATATGTQINQTANRATALGKTTIVQGLPIARPLAAVVRPYATVGAGIQPGIIKALSAISRGLTTPTFRAATDIRANSGTTQYIGKATVTAKLFESYRFTAAPITGKGKVIAPLTYLGGSNLGQLVVFSKATVQADLFKLLGLPAVTPARGVATVVLPDLTVRLGAHLAAVTTGRLTVTPTARALWAMRATSRGSTFFNQQLYRLFPVSTLTKGRARTSADLFIFLALQGNRVVGRGKLGFSPDMELDVIYGGLPVGDQLWHFMRPVTLVGQLWPRREVLPAGVF